MGRADDVTCHTSNDIYFSYKYLEMNLTFDLPSALLPLLLNTTRAIIMALLPCSVYNYHVFAYSVNSLVVQLKPRSSSDCLSIQSQSSCDIPLAGQLTRQSASMADHPVDQSRPELTSGIVLSSRSKEISLILNQAPSRKLVSLTSAEIKSRCKAPPTFRCRASILCTPIGDVCTRGSSF